MKTLFLFFFAILLSHNYTFSQIQIEKTSTISFSPKELNLLKKNMVLTKKVLLKNTMEQPFIALGSVLQGKNSEDFNLSIRYKTKEWSSWEFSKDDIHLKGSKKAYKELFYLPQNVIHIEIKIEAKEREIYKSRNLKIERIDLNFYYPEFTNKITLNKNNIDELESSIVINCSCPIPAYQNRLDWCPSGNCPAQTNPTMTTVSHLIVHHSAGSNTSSDWAARVRSIWNYHVNVKGWSDIGYNYLVDPNGVIYEGRGNNVLGAHFSAMNGGTMGVCLIGDYEPTSGNGTPSTVMIASLEELLSWKECDLSKDPLLSSYHNASSLTLMHISGHRDAGTGTACPGDNVYNMLPNIRTTCSTYMQTCSFTTNADLVVSSLGVSTNPLVLNQNTDILLAIGNGGASDVFESITIELKVDGALIETFNLDSIDAGEVINFTVPSYQFTSLGNHDICMYISSVSSETNTANNSYCTTVQVENATVFNSDLIVSSIQNSSSSLILNEVNNFHVEVKNVGDISSLETVKAKVYVDSVLKQIFTIPILIENNSYSFSFSNTFSSIGIHKVCVEIESPMNEVDSLNNYSCLTVQVENPSSILENNNISKLEIYPNPSNNFLNIELDLINKEEVQIAIFNSLGQNVFAYKNNKVKSISKSINVSNYSKGVYFLDLRIGEASIKQKVIIK